MYYFHLYFKFILKAPVIKSGPAEKSAKPDRPHCITGA
jgi:hypothetical protein